MKEIIITLDSYSSEHITQSFSCSRKIAPKLRLGYVTLGMGKLVKNHWKIKSQNSTFIL